MRLLIVVILVLGLAIAAIFGWLLFTIPHHAEALTFPLKREERSLLARVPASADGFAYAPDAAVLERRLDENPVSRESFATWSAEHSLPHPAILGGADVLLWRKEKVTGFAVELDPVRAVLGRIWLGLTSNADTRWDGNILLVNAPLEPPIDLAELDQLLFLTNGFPPAHALVVQRNEKRGAFPPVGRPAVSVVTVTPAEINIVSRARTNAPDDVPRTARFAQGALISATFAEPPRLAGDLNRLLGARIDDLLREGGAIAIYDVDAGTLLPRPDLVISIPAREATRAALGQVEGIVRLVGETRDTGSELLVSFDRHSLGQYQGDRFAESTVPAGRWALRLDPVRLDPLLGKLSGSAGLRFATPRIHRAVRDLRRWTAALANASSIEASQKAAGGIDELRVRIVSK